MWNTIFYSRKKRYSTNIIDNVKVKKADKMAYFKKWHTLWVYIPDTAQEKPQKGKIVAVGAGTKENPITVKVGDTVLYGKYAGTELKLEGKTYLIMKENDLLGILE